MISAVILVLFTVETLKRPSILALIGYKMSLY